MPAQAHPFSPAGTFARSLNNQLTNTRPAVVMGLAVSLLALPSAMLAFSGRLDGVSSGLGDGGALANYAADHIDPRLARAIVARMLNKGPMFHFTPAGLAARPDRSVTVAVRVDDETASAITVRASPRSAPRALATPPTLTMSSTAYNLGLSRGYQGFGQAGQAGQAFNLKSDTHRLDNLPDLNAYASSDDTARTAAAARLAPRIALDERDRPGRAPRTLESVGEQSVDVGGSYRLTRNIDVTASLRYSQDRDRLKALSDGKGDAQAVFVGTQFRF